jgi:hypothetical protein
LAAVLIELKRKDDAYKLWKSAYEIFKKFLGIHHPNTQTVLEYLVHYFKDRLK